MDCMNGWRVTDRMLRRVDEAGAFRHLCRTAASSPRQMPDFFRLPPLELDNPSTQRFDRRRYTQRPERSYIKDSAIYGSTAPRPGPRFSSLTF